MTDADGREPARGQDERVALTDKARSQLEQFRLAHETQVLTILLSDLEGSTQQQSDLGNIRAAELLKAHRAIFRATLDGFDGQEVEMAGDSFLAVFATPSEGIGFALHMQSAMRQAQEKTPELPAVRVGLHQGQVVVERHGDDSQVSDIYGLQVSTAARIMDMGRGGQVLCSRAVFDDARAILRSSDLEGLGSVAWCNHGPYKFKGMADAYDVCEVGEEGVAPLAAPPASDKSWPADQEEVPGWRPAVGVVVPESNWTLEERLGKKDSTPEGPPQYRGEFGEVWRARNISDKSQQVFKFCFKREHVPALKREARLLKSLQKHRHPNLVEVYDVTVGPRPPYYLQMEYVEGPSLDQWLSTDPPLAERLEMIAQVADALDTVHAAGIFHRDIKPSNILLTHREDGTLQAKLTDFGLGAAEDPELLRSIYVSRVEGVAGTWDYMAPELRDGRQAGPQSDLYSLGMTLYQLVIGNLRHPLTADWQSQIPSEILREDIGRCIAEAPENRWPNAAALATALRTHDQRLRERRLEREREAQRRRAKRLRTIAGVVAAFAIVMVAFGLWALYERALADQLRAEAQKQQAIAVRNEARAVQNEAKVVRLAYSLAISRAWGLYEDGDRAKAVLWQVEALRVLTEGRENDPSIRAAEVNQRLRIQQVLNATPDLSALFIHDGPVNSAAFSPDGKRVVTASDDGTARIWDAATGKEVTRLKHGGEVRHAAFSPDGTRVVTASYDKTARIWDAVTGKEVTRLKHDDWLQHAAFSPDGARVVTASVDKTARIWDAVTGKGGTRLKHDNHVEYAAFSADGTRVVTASPDGTARIWDATTEKEVTRLKHDHYVDYATFSPDGKRVVTASEDKTARIWDAVTGKEVTRLEHDDRVVHAAFSPDGARVVTAAWDKTARIWDAVTGKEVTRLEHDDVVEYAAFSPDGARVVTASEDTTARIWDAATGKEVTRLEHDAVVFYAAFSPDGGRVVTASWDGTARIWDAVTEKEGTRLKHDGVVAYAAFSPDGTRVVTASVDKTARIWDAVTGKEVTRLKHDGWIRYAAFSPDGTRVVTATSNETARIWDAVTGKEVTRLEHGDMVFYAAFSPDGTRVVTASDVGTARIWDAVTGKDLAHLKHGSPVMHAAFSPDGKRVMTASIDATARIWDAVTWKEVTRLKHDGVVVHAAFSPDGKRVVTASRDGSARIWDAVTGKQVTRLKHDGWVEYAAFSPDGKRVVTASRDKTALLWDAVTGDPVTPQFEHDATVTWAPFSRDGTRVATVTEDGAIRVWDTVTGQALTAPRYSRRMRPAFSPDGKRIAAAGNDGTVQLRDLTATKRSLEDLKLFAQLLSGYRMPGETGAIRLMTPDELRETYRQWRAKYGDRASAGK